jgi:S-formylglutathione hydrolase FrmB
LVAAAVAGAEPRPLDFRLTFDPSISRAPFTGRVYVMLFKNDPGENPRFAPSWAKPEPLFAVDVKDWEPDKPLLLGAGALAYPAPLAALPKGEYFIQAVMDFGRGMSFGAGPGNGWCSAGPRQLDPASTGTVDLRLDKVYAEPTFKETDRIKLIDVESKLLSAFHGRPVRLRAGVVLPRSWHDDASSRYPVVYEIPGFSGSHFAARLRQDATNVAGVDMLRVVLDPCCPGGHSAFADSANNGPWGRALVEELIPEIEKQFRGLGTPAGRFVTGHSSGGWSSLWLQISYPDLFGGVWSTAPDPVDFRDFQRIDLAHPGANLFADAAGKPRPLAHNGDKPYIFFRPFSDMEEVMGHGGQLGSFEAVFGPRGADGRPARLWDRRTGAIDPAVARAWQDYDIRLKLERNWSTLGPKLAGKLHVYVGADDTFYLDGAVRLLGESLRGLGSDAVVEVFPGKNHGSLVDAKLRKRIAEEMAAQYRRLNPPAQ